jgi:MiaB-like tRNA modifying enzyme
MKVYLETYGCSANQSDSEIMSGLLKEKGYEIVDSSKKSDLNILNTCIVKSPTENRMKHRIKLLKKIGKPLVVSGCMPKAEKGIVERLVPKASLVGPNSIHVIPEVVKRTSNGEKIVSIDDIKKPKLCLPKIRKNQVIDIVQTSTGCLGNCYYCQVKFAKGELLSYPLELIVKQFKASLKEGVKEIWLTSQDMGAYGKDIGKNLPELLETVVEIKGKFFVRIGMMNPNHVKQNLEELLEVYQSEKIFKFLHIPIQSGSNRILRKMNRYYKVEDFKEIVKAFQKQFPKITLSTDIIAGYPSETENEFKQTLKLLEDVKPDVVNISKYWSRPGTEASEMEQTHRKTINYRTKTLTKLVKKFKRKKNKRWLGWEGEILIDEQGSQGMIGRNYAYKPVVTNGKLGEFKQLRIRNSYTNYLKSY